ncbi:Crp/Fnr family transcriptional regulator [Yoonia sp.]|uniref:Crp/Fnr family transcriptional regulator n=1 Tax=Yoonia sp. TaxID=2212373 RepID=UPI003F6D216B
MNSSLTEPLLQGAGLAGVVLYLGSYALLQIGLLRGSGYAYATLNLCASSLVLLSLTVAFNLSSAIIQTSWIIISLLGIARLAWLNNRVRFSDEEWDMLQKMFPDMPRPMARRFFNQGNWITADKGTTLTEEGQPVVNLYYLANGQVQATSAGQEIAVVSSGFLGEMNVLSRGAASATTTVVAESRLFVISGVALQRMAARDSDFRILLEVGMSRDTGRKLKLANQRLSTSPEQIT